MNNALNKIAEFLNISIDALNRLPLDVLLKMQACIRNDDFFALHHLGYSLTLNR